MENGHGKSIGVDIPSPQTHKSLITTSQIALRIVAAAATLAAASIGLTNNQTVLYFGIEFEARYSYTSAFKFLVAADFITVASSVLSSSFIVFILNRRPSQAFNYFYLFLHDLVVATLLIAGCAAASAEGYLGKYGNSHSGWLAVCDHVSKFCNRMTISLTLSYLAFALYFSITIITAHKSRQIQV